jgi:hypothetical protein
MSNSNISISEDKLQGSRAAEQIKETKSPAFQFSVLTCAVRGQLATKIIHADGKVIGYSKAKWFHFKYCEIDSLEDFAKLALAWLADEPNRFIIRGQLKPDLTGVQRRLKYPDLKTGDPATIECPLRRWIVLDIDGARVLAGLGEPGKLAEAGYHIRDDILPPYFRGVRCIAAASSSTGRKGPTTAHLRLYFVLNRPAENEALMLWADNLSRKYHWIDPLVFQSYQPIYTARPIFHGCGDPVPEWGRIRLLDGYDDELAIELPLVKKAREHTDVVLIPAIWMPDKRQYQVPEELLDITAQDAGLGVPSLPDDTSDKAWSCIKHVFDVLDGCPDPNRPKKLGGARHLTLAHCAWTLAKLVAECELPKEQARAAFFEAAKEIRNGDGKYDAALIERHIDDAFVDLGKR